MHDLDDRGAERTQRKDKRYKLADEGGLYIQVMPNGSKLWRYKYRLHGVEKGLWNFMQAFVFGAYNSGVPDPYTYFCTSLSGPEMLIGGTFGPEGSALTVFAPRGSVHDLISIDTP
jgi:hypothetical protein